MNDKINTFFQSIKEKPKLLMIIGIIGILLIFVSTLVDSNKKEVKQSDTTEITAEEYVKQQEDKLKTMIEDLTGRKTTVILTLETGIEYIYASQAKSDSSEIEEAGVQPKVRKDGSAENSYVIVQDQSGSEIPLVVTKIMPRIKGAVVTLSGVSDGYLQETVTSLVMTALDISNSKVCVLSKQ